MTSPRTAALFCAISALALGGCSFHEPSLHSEQLDFRSVPSALIVDVSAGDVWLRGAPADNVFVKAKIDGPENHVGYELGQQSLTVFDECNEEPCSVDLSLDVPENVALTLRTGSGDVWVENVRGDISLRTGSGDITGIALAGLDFSADTGSGDVRCALAPAERVRLRTGSGDVALTVPYGAYRLNISTSAGDQKVEGVQADEAAQGTIDVSTGSGDLKITGI